MQLTAVQRILGLLLMLFSITLLPPLAVSYAYDDGVTTPFLVSFCLTLLTGLFFWWPVRRRRSELRMRDGFLIVVMFWTVLGLFGALPLMLSHQPHLSITDAVFESISGLTTTGATIIAAGLDTLPKSILYHRAQLHFLGGMGIIVLAVAILPLLGIGGMQLFRAETPGPMKDSKLTPRITETAKGLWYVYLILNVACTLAYWAGGMSCFDAITHAFSTLALGGFSTHDASFAYFNSPLLEAIAIFFMFLAGMNFALHFLAWRANSWKVYIQDSEWQVYMWLLLISLVLVVGYLWLSGTYADPLTALRHGAFQLVSVATTTGLLTTGFADWPGFLPVFILFTSLVVSCAGSTGGGIKAIRFLLLIKQGGREIKRLIHPAAQIPIKVGHKAVPDRVIEAVWGFFALWVATFFIMGMLLMATGLDAVSAFSGVLSCMTNAGPGLGSVTMNFMEVSDFGKWVLTFAMLLGRLEIFTLLVLLSPAFWRK